MSAVLNAQRCLDAIHHSVRRSRPSAGPYEVASFVLTTAAKLFARADASLALARTPENIEEHEMAHLVLDLAAIDYASLRPAPLGREGGAA